MKIEIEGSEDAVMNIIRAITTIPQVNIEKIAKTFPEKKVIPRDGPIEEKPSPTPKLPKELIIDTNCKTVVSDDIDTNPSSTTEAPRKSEGGGRTKRFIEVFSGDIVKGFSLEKSCESISDAARYIGAPHAANISNYIDSGKVYKEKYKFISRKA